MQKQRLLYSVMVRLKNITITATTPANSGVRFETGLSELYISNRVQNMQQSSSSGGGREKLNRYDLRKLHLYSSLCVPGLEG